MLRGLLPIRVGRMTSFGRRLAAEFEQEFSRLVNEWCLKWHELARGEPIDLDDFRGGRIRLGGMRFDASAELTYWNALQRYARGKIDETFGETEKEICLRAGIGLEAVAEDAAIQLRSFLERLHRHAVFTEYRLQARGYPDECYLDARKDGATAAEIQNRKMALIERYRALSLRQKIALAAVSFARGQAGLAPILLLAAVLAALVLCFSCFTAAAGVRESALYAGAGGKFAARLSTVRFAIARSNPARPSGE
jgi:hypothetical protein